MATEEGEKVPVYDCNLLRLVLCLVAPRDLLRAQASYRYICLL
jgi:hypothetical protein